jgi:hypothetical protein
MATKAELEAELAAVAAEFFRLVDEANALQRAGNTGPEYQALSARISVLRAERVRINRELATLANESTPQPAPPATASQAAQEDGPQGPTKPPVQEVGTNGRVAAAPPVTPPTNAEPTPTTATNADTNTNPETVTLQQSQATTPQTLSNQPLKAPAVGASAEGSEGEGQARAQLQSGVGANSADAADNSAKATQATVNAASNSPIKIQPQANVLDKFSSYTYQASVYLMSPAQYTQLLNSKKKTVNGYQLLFQSGGAGNNVGGPQGASGPGFAAAQADLESEGIGFAPTVTTPGANSPDAGRNPFFDYDFYIDSITMDNALPGKQTGAAHAIFDLKFTVIEPMGMSLLDRLYSAVKDYAPKDDSGVVNYTAAVYLMVIRFFGYDLAGNLITPGSTTSGDGASNPQSVVEKFVPFVIKKINWSVGNKLVNYDFECAPVGQFVGGTTARGTIPYDIELTASTVGKLLKGNAKYGTGTSATANPGASTTTNQSDAETARLNRQASNASAPQKANAAPTDKKTITGGLMDAMNQFQQELVRRGTYTIADQYELEFANGGLGEKANEIEDATVVLSDNRNVDKKGTPVNGPPTKEGGRALDPARQASDLAQRSMAITAGQQIVQAIELAIRNSSYIYNQSLIITNPDGTQVPNPEARNKPMRWFLITMSATQIGDKIDPKRNDYAYKIKYTVTPYRVPNFDSKYFPVTQFPGLHKQYNYWFTGQNNAVLDYQAQFNSLYNITVSGSTPDDSYNQKIRETFTSSMRDIPRYVAATRSTESGAGGPGKSNEVGANAAEYFYSPGDLHSAKIKIIGDPAWIQQGSLYRPITDQTFTGVNATPGFLADGTIDFDSSQVLFEIAWQRPEDYDLLTGLADPYSKTQAKYGERQPLQSNVYQATRVNSEFRQGKFEQTITAALYFFPKPDGTNAIAGNATAAVVKPVDPANQTAATQKRLGVDLSNGSAGGGRGNGQIQLMAERVKAGITSVTGTQPTSSLAQGVQQVLSPPTNLPDPTLTQLTSSQVYKNARLSGQTGPAALQAARDSFAATAGGSPVSSNGQAVATNTGSSPPVAGTNTRLTAQQLEQLASSQRKTQPVTRDY